jgi:phosphoribosyl 1,2-cyclic phosphodiesterase
VIRGCRGSLATPGPRTLRYGGNTSCVEVRLDDGSFLILDAGTGIRELGLELGPDTGPIHLLLTHLHLDHLEGLGFFAPLWRPETELHIWGPPSPVDSLASRIARYLSPPLFPILLWDVPAKVTFHDVPDDPWSIGNVVLTAQQVIHPGPTVAYRVEADGGVLAYVPDHEPYLGGTLVDQATEWISGLDVAFEAGLLLHDSQFTEAEYPERVGWGHSSVAHAVEFARVASAERLVLFHHDPFHSDEELERLERRAAELWGDTGFRPSLAVEGEELSVVSCAAVRD